MDNNSDDDNGEDGSKLLSEPQKGDVLSILSNNPRLIRLADSMGDNVFHMSARNGDIETICKLIAFLEEGQDEDLERVLTDVNVNGDTPLHLALMNAHDKVSYHLGCANLQATIMRNNDGISPFELAERAGYSEYPWSYYSAHHLKNFSATNARRNFPVHWIELKRAIEKGKEDDLFTGLQKHGKKLLWHITHDTPCVRFVHMVPLNFVNMCPICLFCDGKLYDVKFKEECTNYEFRVQ